MSDVLVPVVRKNLSGRRRSRAQATHTRPTRYLPRKRLKVRKTDFGGCRSVASVAGAPPLSREIAVAHRTQLDARISESQKILPIRGRWPRKEDLPQNQRG